jgi:flagellar protein FliJ
MSNYELRLASAFDQVPQALGGLAPGSDLNQSYGPRRRSRETLLLRLKKLQVDNGRRQVAQIEAMIADLDRMETVLESEIHAEENRTGIHDAAHFAYSTYAKATIARRNNLNRTVSGLKDQLAVAKSALANALGEQQG